MQITKFDTAVRLNKSGFRRPRPKLLQTWYTNDGRPGMVTSLGKWNYDGEIYAPSATDILRRMVGYWALKMVGKTWVVFSVEPLISFKHRNPAEAAAKAWFFEQEKKKKK